MSLSLCLANLILSTTSTSSFFIINNYAAEPATLASATSRICLAALGCVSRGEGGNGKCRGALSMRRNAKADDSSARSAFYWLLHRAASSLANHLESERMRDSDPCSR